MNKKILRIAIPSIVSNVTIPLLGLVDLGLSGHLGATAFIGAIAVGSTIFNIIYWLCGFLRMTTGGRTAQTLGHLQQRQHLEPQDEKRVRTSLPTVPDSELLWVLLRSMTLACIIALSLLLLQVPLFRLADVLLAATPGVMQLTAEYFRILIWGVPAVLFNLCLAGWFLGMQEARVPMVVSIVQNVINIVLSFFLVVVCGWKIAGVAMGTLVAQWCGLLMYFSVPLLTGKDEKRKMLIGHLLLLLRRRTGEKMLPARRDLGGELTLFLRTLCMIVVQVWFTSFGARQSDVLLSANAVLFQFFMIFSYFMDGFAYAGEAIGGRYFGAGRQADFRRLTRVLFVWGTALSLLFFVVYLFGGHRLVGLLTDDAPVIAATADYLVFAALVPLVGCAAFLLDGLFIGITRPRPMLLSVVVATLVFVAILQLPPALAGGRRNVLLWCAFLSTLAARSVVLSLFYPSIFRSRRR